MDYYSALAARRRHGGVEGSAGDAADGEAADGDAGADGEAEEVGGLGALGHGDAEHHEAQHEGVDDLCHGDAGPSAGAHRSQAKGGAPVDEGVGERCRDAAQHLHASIGACLGRGKLRAAAGSKDGHRDGGVEVCAGDITQGVDHGGESRGDGEGGGLGVAQHVKADGQDQHVSAQELADQLGQLALLTTEILWAYHLEEGSGHGRTQELEDDVGDGPAKATARAGDVDAQGHGRVEAAAGHGASTIGARHHSEGDGHAIVLVLLGHVLLGCGHIHDHEGEHERVEQLTEPSMVPGEALGRHQVEAHTEKQGVANGSCDACGGLHAAVDAHGLPVQARASHGTGDAQRHGHGRVEVGARDATQRVDADHQHEGDGHAGPGGRTAQHVAAHREDQQEGAHELRRALGGHRWLRGHG